MKTCRQCGQENNDFISVCPACHHSEFELAELAIPLKPRTKQSVSKIPHVITETDGRISILKCRTPDEAFLVAEQLEAADILVIFPDDEDLSREFQTHGYVSLKVSTQHYAAAKELQEVIECRQWRKIGAQALPVEMVLLAIGMGVIFFPGFIISFWICRGYETKGFSRRGKTFFAWFMAGFALDVTLIMVLAKQ